MRSSSGVALGALAAIVIGCAAGRRAPQAQVPPSTAESMPSAPSSAHDQISALDHQIDDELARMGLPPASPPTCAAAGCATTAPEAMAVKPFAQDPTCRPAASDTCQGACTLADSICGNADRICELAKQLGSADAYANERCARGKTSCEAAHAKCCSCQL